MKSQAYFEKIHKEIESRLLSAKSVIRLAVAWFTDPKLFTIICEKAKCGLEVEIMLANHEINFDSSINYRDLVDNGGKLHWIGYDYAYAPLMHNKFCIIDNKILIFGSYNWTKKAKSNHESITIIEEDDGLILDFNQEFDKLINKYLNKDEIKTDWVELTIRLDTLVNAITLEDYDDIKYQIEKTKNLLPKNTNDVYIQNVISALKFCSEKRYSKAIALIRVISREHKKIIVFEDPEISALQLEIKSLQFQVTSLEDEKTDIEKTINLFNLQYNLELGETIKRILFIKKKLAKKVMETYDTKMNREDYTEAKMDYDDFSKSFEEKVLEKKPIELDKAGLKDLKQLYRMATKLCHPDMVLDEQKENAEKVFNDLKNAYESNDVLSVKNILDNLERGIFKSKGENVTQKDKLRIMRQELEFKRKILEKSLIDLKKSEAYIKIIEINNWDIYFETVKIQFEGILKDLKYNLEAISHEK